MVLLFFKFAEEVRAAVTFTPESRAFFDAKVAPTLQAEGLWAVTPATCTLRGA